MAAKANTVPVTLRAVIQRINRKLAGEDKRLKATRGERARSDLGDYYLLNVNRNFIAAHHVDPEALARELGVIPQKVHYWIKQGWIHSRRTPSGKHWIVWADKDEVRRLKRLAKVKQSWLRARHPDLIIPKRRPAR